MQGPRQAFASVASVGLNFATEFVFFRVLC